MLNDEPLSEAIKKRVQKMGNSGKKVYLVIGCPGAGKSWVCDQLAGTYNYVHHDLRVDMTGPAYVKAICAAAEDSTKPLLAEAPFSVSQTKEPLEKLGFDVVPVVIQETQGVIEGRYLKRENKKIPPGHITRQSTYLDRAKQWKCFTGTSSQVLEHLRGLAK
jgi:predicted ATPase